MKLKTLDNLVRDFYNEHQINKVKETENKHTKGTHLSNYESLLWAFKSADTVTAEEVCDFYHVNDVNVLQNVDWIIVSIIKTLTRLTEKNIKKGFNDSFVLDPVHPELQYLIEETRKCLEMKQAG